MKCIAGLPYWKEANVDSKITLHIGDASDSLKKLLKVSVHDRAVFLLRAVVMIAEWRWNF